MNIVDSSGWMEYFAAGANSSFFAPAIADVQRLVVPSISLYEVFKKTLGSRSHEEALQAVAVMMAGSVAPLTADIALNAAALSLELKLPMADSIMLATARAYNATFWTQDADFRDITGVRYISKR